jgi:hypothetical protein
MDLDIAGVRGVGVMTSRGCGRSTPSRISREGLCGLSKNGSGQSYITVTAAGCSFTTHGLSLQLQYAE